MRGIDAASVSAQMIQFHSFWYRTNLSLEHDAVRHLEFSMMRNNAIYPLSFVRHSGVPRPAAARRIHREFAIETRSGCHVIAPCANGALKSRTFQKRVPSLYVPVTLTPPVAVAFCAVVVPVCTMPTVRPSDEMLPTVVDAGMPVPDSAIPTNQPSEFDTRSSGEPFCVATLALTSGLPALFAPNVPGAVMPMAAAAATLALDLATNVPAPRNHEYCTCEALAVTALSDTNSGKPRFAVFGTSTALFATSAYTTSPTRNEMLVGIARYTAVPPPQYGSTKSICVPSG